MAKQEKKSQVKEPKERKALVGRIKKVVKKSRRKLSEEKFEKELQRTISFLEQLQTRLGTLTKESTQKEEHAPVKSPKPVKKHSQKRNAGAKSARKKAKPVAATLPPIPE